MADVVKVHVDLADVDPAIPQTDRCPEHPDAEPEMGYGAAGGGMGVYVYCSVCGTMLSKTQDEGA